MNKLFVFGTLKEGFPNFNKNKGSRLAGDFHTRKPYPLYLIGERSSPWLILEEGQGHQVYGQVFNVSGATLLEMDKLERISETDGYQRVELEVCCQQTGEAIKVFAYGKSIEQLSTAIIQCELSGEYTLEHAALYRARNP